MKKALIIPILVVMVALVAVLIYFADMNVVKRNIWEESWRFDSENTKANDLTFTLDYLEECLEYKENGIPENASISGAAYCAGSATFTKKDIGNLNILDGVLETEICQYYFDEGCMGYNLDECRKVWSIGYKRIFARPHLKEIEVLDCDGYAYMIVTNSLNGPTSSTLFAINIDSEKMEQF